MYMDQLARRNVRTSEIYLDPNNPRFWKTEGTASIRPDRKIMDPGVQATATKEIASYGIDELYSSMVRNGFLLLDRIVVRPIEGHEGKFVVVEGNRRFTALSRLRTNIDSGLIDEADMSEEAQSKFIKDTAEIEVLVYSGDGTKDISWMLQGIRHIGGIRDWSPAQQAKLVAEQIDDHGQGLRSTGEQFGLTAIATGRLYRSYKAIMQMQADDEYRGKAKNNYFTLFQEAIGNPSMRDWLGWKDADSKFHKAEELRLFYSWISPDDDHEGDRRIHDPKHVKKLAFLIAGNHKTLLDDVNSYRISIEDAEAKARAGGARERDWRDEIKRSKNIIAELPLSAMLDDPAAFATELDGFIESVTEQRDKARKLIGGE
jgi:hypothetical protein